MDALIIIAFLFIIFAVVVIIMAIRFMIKKKNSFKKFIEENGFSEARQSKPFQDGKVIIFDDKKNLLWIYQPFAKKQINFSPSVITECELQVDDDVNFKTSAVGVAGRALVGVVLAGGVGAIVGGATAGKKGSTVVKRMQLTISTSDLDNPYVRIIALQDAKGIKRDGLLFRLQYDNAMHWCKFIEALPHIQKTEPLS